MKWNRLLLVAGAVAMLAAGPTPATKPPASPVPEEAQQQASTSLLVQTAMQQGRESLARGEYHTAVRVLEAQLPKINGNTAYLGLLEEAYRGYVKELRQKGQEELAQRYLERLAILDPGVMLTASVRQPTPTTEQVKPASTPATIRAQAQDESPKPAAKTPAQPQQAKESLAQADKEFQAKHYREACSYYHKAYQADPGLSQASKERWAYCKLHAVTEQINNPPAAGLDWFVLETEVRTALSLAPRLEYGQTLLKTIEERSRLTPATTKARYSVQHLAEKQNGWEVAESTNFRCYHTQSEYAEQALQVAEQTRTAVLMKWLGEKKPEAWPDKCDIYLHATAEAYSRATGVPTDSPGHSSIGAERSDASRVTSRRMDLHTDDRNLLRAVLPHETTHVVLAGLYGRQPLPRWADEGIAVLSEPYDKIDRHYRVLPQVYQEGRVFTAEQLMKSEDYPQAGMMSAFYAQSVALVDYLTEVKGPRTLTEFLRDAQRTGYEAALKKHYEMKDFAELDQRLRRFALVDRRSAATASAER